MLSRMSMVAGAVRVSLPLQASNLKLCAKSDSVLLNIRSFKTSTSLQTSQKHFIRRARERMGFKESIMQPTSGTPFSIGQGAVAGAAVFGLGALCYYGLNLSNEAGASAMDRSIMWPQHVKDRIHTTYEYFAGSVVASAATAVTAFRSPAFMNLMMRNSWVVLGASFAAMIGSGIVVRSMEYKPGFGKKQIAWLAHSSIMGAVLAPICLMGGPILLRAATMTGGIVGGLSAIAVCAPSEKFMNMGGPLAIGLGVVFASSIGTMFLPPTTALGAGLYSMSLYGGLILFSGFLLYDTQRIMHHAENLPERYTYDPVNASISIYLDTLNIFIRVAQILAMGGGGRKK